MAVFKGDALKTAESRPVAGAAIHMNIRVFDDEIALSRGRRDAVDRGDSYIVEGHGDGVVQVAVEEIADSQRATAGEIGVAVILRIEEFGDGVVADEFDGHRTCGVGARESYPTVKIHIVECKRIGDRVIGGVTRVGHIVNDVSGVGRVDGGLADIDVIRVFRKWVGKESDGVDVHIAVWKFYASKTLTGVGGIVNVGVVESDAIGRAWSQESADRIVITLDKEVAMFYDEVFVARTGAVDACWTICVARIGIDISGGIGHGKDTALGEVSRIWIRDLDRVDIQDASADEFGVGVFCGDDFAVNMAVANDFDGEIGWIVAAIDVTIQREVIQSQRISIRIISHASAVRMNWEDVVGIGREHFCAVNHMP